MPRSPPRLSLPEGRLASADAGYQRSQDFLGLRERTRADYIKQIVKIEQKFGDCSAQGARRSAHARHVHGLARRAGAAIEAAGRLCVDRAGLRAVVGEGSRQDHRQSLRAGRSRLSRHARRFRVERRGRGGVSRTRAGASALAALARAMDRAAARRPVAAAVVGL